MDKVKDDGQTVSVRLLTEEKNLLQFWADSKKKTMSQYIRENLFNSKEQRNRKRRTKKEHVNNG
jgi:predicted DNA-binding protein